MSGLVNNVFTSRRAHVREEAEEPATKAGISKLQQARWATNGFFHPRPCPPFIPPSPHLPPRHRQRLPHLPRLRPLPDLLPLLAGNGPDCLDDQFARVVRVLRDGEGAVELGPCTRARGGDVRIRRSYGRRKGKGRWGRKEERGEDVPISTTIASFNNNNVCFQCVGVSHAPVVKNTSPSCSLTLSFRFDESQIRGAEVKYVSKWARRAWSLKCSEASASEGEEVVIEEEGG